MSRGINYIRFRNAPFQDSQSYQESEKEPEKSFYRMPMTFVGSYLRPPIAWNV